MTGEAVAAALEGGETAAALRLRPVARPRAGQKPSDTVSVRLELGEAWPSSRLSLSPGLGQPRHTGDGTSSPDTGFVSLRRDRLQLDFYHLKLGQNSTIITFRVGAILSYEEGTK